MAASLDSSASVYIPSWARTRTSEASPLSQSSALPQGSANAKSVTTNTTTSITASNVFSAVRQEHTAGRPPRPPPLSPMRVASHMASGCSAQMTWQDRKASRSQPNLLHDEQQQSGEAGDASNQVARAMTKKWDAKSGARLPPSTRPRRQGGDGGGGVASALAPCSEAPAAAPPHRAAGRHGQGQKRGTRRRRSVPRAFSTASPASSRSSVASPRVGRAGAYSPLPPPAETPHLPPPPCVWPSWFGALVATPLPTRRVSPTSDACSAMSAAQGCVQAWQGVRWSWREASAVAHGGHVMSSSRNNLADGLTSPPPPPPPLPVYTPDEQSLSRELLDFARYVSLTEAECAAREALLTTLTAIIHKTAWPTFVSLHTSALVANRSGSDGSGAGDASPTSPRVVVYGSAALGLSLCTSDVDLTLVFPHVPNTTATNMSTDARRDNQETAAELAAQARSRAQARLRALYFALTDHLEDNAMRVQVLEECKVPVAKLYDPRHGLSVDVHVCEEDEMVPRKPHSSGGLVVDTITEAYRTRTEKVLATQRDWLARHPIAAPLIVITKAALQQWNLNRLFTGGLSSTAVYSLVHRFLEEQSCVVPVPATTRSLVEAGSGLCRSPLPPPLTESNLIKQRLASASRCHGEEDVRSVSDEQAGGVARDAKQAAALPCTVSPSCVSTAHFTTATMSMTKSNSNSQLAWSSCASTDGSHSEDAEEALTVRCEHPLLSFEASPTDAARGVGHGPSHLRRAEAMWAYDWANQQCQTRYHTASFSRLLISLWIYLSNENFAMGYCIPDTFAALVRAEQRVEKHRDPTPMHDVRNAADYDQHEDEEEETSMSDSAHVLRPSSSSAPPSTLSSPLSSPLPPAERHESPPSRAASPSPAATPAAAAATTECSSSSRSRSHKRSVARRFYGGKDLSAPSYRLPELLALLRHSAMTLEAFLTMPVSPVLAHSPVFHYPLSPLSTVLVDPRIGSS